MWLVCSIHNVQARDTWPFKANDTIELLNRFLTVIGGDEPSADETLAAGGIGDAEDRVTSSLTPRVSKVLKRKCEEIVRTLPETIGRWPPRNNFLRALRVIRK